LNEKFKPRSATWVDSRVTRQDFLFDAGELYFDFDREYGLYAD
jgi:hypothetical protein